MTKKKACKHKVIKWVKKDDELHYSCYTCGDTLGILVDPSQNALNQAEKDLEGDR